LRCVRCGRRFSIAVRNTSKPHAALTVAEVREGEERTYLENLEVTMVAELNIVTEWLPEQMEPGSIFVLENAGEVGDQDDPYWAVLACPECGTLGLITRKQMRGLLPVICGSDKCSAQFMIQDEQVVPKQPN